jgi:pantothenate synthetase
MRDLADKLRNGFFGDAEKRKAAQMRDEMDAAEADIKAGKEAR